MVDSGYTSVADTYRTHRQPLYSSRQEHRSSGKHNNKEKFSKLEMIRWGRLLLCAIIFGIGLYKSEYARTIF